tara:strand:+ start:165 stop:1961 length:1797 start_codon:yes stop_codon:yes gene_type:complete
MSLLITSNDERDNTTGSLAGQMPASYSNYLSQPLRIKPDSQIAVHSVKIRKDPQFMLKGGGNRLYFWFGEKLNYNQDGTGTTILKKDTTSNPLLALMRPKDYNLNKAVYTAEDMAVQMTTEMNGYLYHPNIYGKLLVEPSRDDSTNDFEGFTYKFTQRGDDATLDNIPSTWLPRYLGDGFTFETNTFTKTSDTKTAFGLGTDYPLSWSNGLCEYDITGTSTGAISMVGLARSWYGDQREPSYFASASFGFWDYVIRLAPDVAGTDRNLKIFHSVVDEARQDKMTMKEVKYYGTHTGAVGTIPLKVTADSIDYVRFRIVGEQVIVEYATGVAPDTWINITDTSNWSTATKDNFCKPLNQNTWAIYPQIYLEELNDSVTIDQFGGIDNGGTDYEYKWQTKNVDWWYTMNALGESVNRVCKPIDFRYMNKTFDTQKHQPVGLNASNGINYSNVMIVAPSLLYKESHGANTGTQMGFKNESVVDTPLTISGSSVTFKSNTTPTGMSDDPIYIKMTNLPIQSYNAITHGVGQIVGVLPQADNQGNSTGGLMFMMDDRLYIDLNNASELQMNSFDIQLCNKREQIVGNLVGSTNVIFHIRDKPK